MDLKMLSNVFSLLLCPDCSSSSLSFGEILKKKIGFASLFVLSCKDCAWSHEFHSSHVMKGGFEVNKRVVYAMRSIGQGFSGAKKFCSIMNIANLPTKNNYSKLNKTLNSAVFNVANESMERAGQEVSSSIGTDCGVSVDGSWQKRGYVSMNGCVTTISMDTGRILDVEAMSRFCKQCQVYEKLEKTSEKYHVPKSGTATDQREVGTGSTSVQQLVHALTSPPPTETPPSTSSTNPQPSSPHIHLHHKRSHST